MATETREISWMQLLGRIDPEWKQMTTRAVEYEFTARGLPIEPTGDTTEFENGQRVFRANERTRGAYAADVVGSDELTWGDLGLTWDGESLSFEDE